MSRFKFSQKNIIQAIFFLTFASGSAWLSFFTLFIKEYVGLTDGQVGMISAIQQANTLLIPIWGILADRVGRRNILMINIFLVIFMLWGFLFHHVFLTLFFFTGVFCFFYNPITTLVDSISMDYVEQSGDSSFGAIRMWASLGWAVSAIATGYFVKPENITLIFPIASGIQVINWLILRFIYQPLKVVKNLRSLKMSHFGEILFSDKRLIIMFILMLFYGIFSAPIHLFISIYYGEIGAGYFHVGYAYAFQALSELPFFFYGKKIIQRVGARRIIVITMFVTALRMFSYYFISNPWIAIVLGTTHGICFALFLVAFVSYVHQFIPPEWRATGQSFVYAFYFGGGMALGNLWTGFISNKIGMKGAMVVEASLVILLIIVTFFIFGIIKRITKSIGDRYRRSIRFIKNSDNSVSG